MDGPLLLASPVKDTVLDVPGDSSCWVAALIAPLIRAILEYDDWTGTVGKVRRRLSQAVLQDPDAYKSWMSFAELN